MYLEPAYLAGVLDSDGSISIVRRKKQKTINGFHYRAVFQLSWIKKDLTMEVLSELVVKYGGNLNEIESRWKGQFQSHNSVLKYSLEGHGLDRFLSDVLPYVKLKREQVFLAIMMRTNRREWQRMRIRTKPDWAWQKEHDIYKKFKGLNTKNGHN